MKQMFISDLHLDPGLGYLREGFLRFLQAEARSADHLYILGDFFEVWLGDDHETKFNHSIINALKEVKNQVFLMHGNRDFLIGDAFCKAAEVALLEEPSVIETPAGAALLLHGDTLCTRDLAYMDLRKTLRSVEFQNDFLAKSLSERDAIVRQLRGASQSHTRETAADIMDVTAEEVVNALADAGVSIMIHGHTHRPAAHRLRVDENDATRYVLGDWGETMQYLLIEDETPRLLTYSVRV